MRRNERDPISLHERLQRAHVRQIDVLGRFVGDLRRFFECTLDEPHPGTGIRQSIAVDLCALQVRLHNNPGLRKLRV